jgi:hypothetical protein
MTSVPYAKTADHKQPRAAPQDRPHKPTGEDMALTRCYIVRHCVTHLGIIRVEATDTDIVLTRCYIVICITHLGAMQ